MKWQHRILSLILALMMVPLFQSPALARRKRKFKGVIIVNQVLKLDGTMTLNGHPAPEFSGVKEGDVIETGEKSFAIIRIVGLGIFRMGPLARLKLKSFHNRDESKFELEGGEVLSLFKRPGSHEMDMPHSKLNLHQSVFIARVGNGDGDEVQLIDGRIVVKDLLAKKDREAVVLTPPTSESLNPKIPKVSNVSQAEIKAPTKDILDVAPHPAERAAPAAPGSAQAPSTVTNDEAVLPAEATVAPEGHLKLIRLTSAGVSIIDQQVPDDSVKRKISDLESLYALP
jgi:hypothetical protein